MSAYVLGQWTTSNLIETFKGVALSLRLYITYDVVVCAACTVSPVGISTASYTLSCTVAF